MPYINIKERNTVTVTEIFVLFIVVTCFESNGSSSGQNRLKAYKILYRMSLNLLPDISTATRAI